MFLHTKRLVLRNFSESNIDAFLAYRNEPEVAKFQSWSVPYSREQAQKFISSIKDVNAPKQGSWLQSAIALKENDERSVILAVSSSRKMRDRRLLVLRLHQNIGGKAMPLKRFAAGLDISLTILISTV